MPEHFSSDRRRISAGGSAEASYALSQYIDLDAIRSTGQIVDRIYEEHDAVMPKATKVAYEHRQQEFKDCHTVTPDKTAGFIKGEVIGGKKRHTGLKTDAAYGPEGPDIEATVGQSIVGQATVNLYIAAIVKLWELQKRQRINLIPIPGMAH